MLEIGLCRTNEPAHRNKTKKLQIMEKYYGTMLFCCNRCLMHERELSQECESDPDWNDRTIHVQLAYASDIAYLINAFIETIIIFIHKIILFITDETYLAYSKKRMYLRKRSLCPRTQTNSAIKYTKTASFQIRLAIWPEKINFNLCTFQGLMILIIWIVCYDRLCEIEMCLLYLLN